MDNHICILLGKTLTEINKLEDEIIFKTLDEEFKMYHDQDCCEDVKIDDIVGDLSDLVGNPVLHAVETTSESDNDDWGSETWTFYHIATKKGWVTIRWWGQSNGYYSESVSFKKMK